MSAVPPREEHEEKEKGCVLVIDDDPAIREVVSTILVLEGYCVEAAGSGADALELLQGGVRPRLILMDLRMPGVDGWTLHDKLKHEPALAKIPVVVISGDRDATQAGSSLCVDGVLTKPIDLTDLLQTVERHC